MPAPCASSYGAAVRWTEHVLVAAQRRLSTWGEGGAQGSSEAVRSTSGAPLVLGVLRAASLALLMLQAPSAFAGSPTLFLGVERQVDGVWVLDDRFGDELRLALLPLGPGMGPADVPLFAGPDGLLDVWEYLYSCRADDDRETCEIICGFRASAGQIVAATVRGTAPDETLELRHVDMATLDSLRITASAALPADAIARQLLDALQQGTAPAQREEQSSSGSVENVEVLRVDDEVSLGDGDWVSASDGAFTMRRPTLTEQGVARECAKLGLTPRQYRDWQRSGWTLAQYRRFAAGRQGRVSIGVALRGLAGTIAPDYAAEIAVADDDQGSLAWGLGEGLAQEFALSTELGMSSTLSLRAELGLAWGPTSAWYLAYSDELTPSFRVSEESDGLVRPSLTLGPSWTTRPGRRLHPRLGGDACMLWLGVFDGVRQGFPDSGSGVIPGARVRGGLAWEGRGGNELEPQLLAGIWARGLVTQEGQEAGPATWHRGVPFWVGLGLVVGPTWARSQNSFGSSTFEEAM